MKPDDINTRHDGEEPQAPQKLVAALKEPPARRVFVPPAIDEAVLNAARRHLAAPRRAGSVLLDVLRSRLAWPALTAACLVLAGFVYFFTKPGRETPEFAREDLNRDGQVDILDAFQLARGLQNGEEPATKPDLNDDGVVDRRDAELIAARAVRLEKGGRS